MTEDQKFTLVVAVLGLVVSGAVAWFAFWQAALTRRSLRAETLMHLDGVWRSEVLRKSRAAAAKALLEISTRKKTALELYDSSPSDVDDVLDYLETIAFLCNRKVIDPDLVWNMFYWPLESYWQACADYIPLVREKEGAATWENFTAQLPALRELSGDDPLPDEEAVALFLRSEVAKFP